MDQDDGGEDEPRKATYIIHPCLKCGRLLYMVVKAVSWCGKCFEPNSCEEVSDYDGQDEEE